LLNIVFSDEFAEAFACLGDALTRQDLDAAVKREDRFWKAVHARFLDDAAVDVGLLQFSHPAIDACLIDPSNIVPHGWEKLRAIYRDTRSSYRAAIARITSGQHEDDFFSYCNGKIDALYMHLHTRERPLLSEVVNSELPADVFADSEVPSSVAHAKSDVDGSSVGSNPAKRRRSNGPSIADAIDKFVKYSTNNSAADQRSLFYENETHARKLEQLESEPIMNRSHICCVCRNGKGCLTAFVCCSES